MSNLYLNYDHLTMLGKTEIRQGNPQPSVENIMKLFSQKKEASWDTKS